MIKHALILTFLATILILTPTIHAADPVPVSWWKFDETFGTNANDSEGANHGTLIGDPTWTTGIINGALDFDGDGDYVSVPESSELDITGDITISAWVNFTAGGSEKTIVAKTVSNGAYRNPFDFRTNSAAEPAIKFVRADRSGHETVYSTQPIPIQTWHHVLVRVENNVADFYVDGVITGKTGGLTKPAEGNDHPLLIGKRDDGWPFNGKIDDVRIYDKALSAGEIAAIYGSVFNNPVIALSSNTFNFDANEGGDNPADQILSISNIAGGILDWEITETCDWLSVDPNTGSSTGATDINQVTLSVDVTGLNWGTYNCQLTVSDPCASNTPQTVEVALVVRNADGLLYVPLEYRTIQEAIDFAATGNEVIIAEGTYTGTGNRNLNFLGKAITVRSSDPNDPDVVAATIIDCENSSGHRGFYFHSGEDANSIINGLTIKRGYITGDSARGGGIYCTASSPTIKNCIIANNQAIAGWDDYAYGAGISCINGSSPTIKSCHIVDNYAEGGPGGSGGYDGFPGAGAQGGGIYSTDDLVIENCVIRNNTAKGGDGGDGYGDQQYYGRGGDGGDAYGAGISTTGSSSILFNNLIIGNSAIGGDGGSSYMVPDGLEGSAYGGAIYGSDFLVTNCTISDNSSEGLSGAGGISGTGTVTNCILWGNGDDLHGCSATYSCIEDGDAGTGNISTDPDFVSGPLGDYYLSQTAAGQPTTSPCVNTGSDTAANLNMDILTTRTDQILDSGTVDMGYHYSLLESPDINFDGDVDLDDFAILASQWRQPPGTPSADIEPPGGDGVVDEFDLAILTDYWLWGVVVPNSLVSHWKFDETSGATAYDSAGTNHGILANGTVWTTGQIDGALYFDGSDDYVSVPDSLELNITGDITISAWVNFTAGGSEQAIVTKTVSNGAINNPFDFRTSSAAEPTLRFVRADASGAEIVFSTEPIPIQSWHHVAIRIENNVADFYVDGDITGKTGGLTKPATGNSNPLLIGKRDDGWPFNGKIDDVRIYNYALSAEEILSLYQQGSE